MNAKKLRLGVNIDHVATVRNARGISHPSPLRAAKIAEAAGADGITAHLREDRRHVVDDDIFRLKNEINLPLNMEMAATKEMLKIALEVIPNAACLVPEKREEVTTEGGLDVIANYQELLPVVSELRSAGIRVSLFVDPEEAQLEAASRIGADIVELHTGAYCSALSFSGLTRGSGTKYGGSRVKPEGDTIDSTNPFSLYPYQRIINAAKVAENLGLECHAGHGLCYDTVAPIAAIPNIVELNIGHFLIGEAIFTGLEASIQKMKKLMDDAR